MHLLKRCPSCDMKLRFPIDKGIIKIKCKCGYSFTANPDNPELYYDTDFDLSLDNKRKNIQRRISNIRNMISNISIEDLYVNIINRILDIKYKIQNFKLLPSSEKKKIIVMFFIVVSLITIIIYIFIHLLRRAEPKALLVLA